MYPIDIGFVLIRIPQLIRSLALCWYTNHKHDRKICTLLYQLIANKSYRFEYLMFAGISNSRLYFLLENMIRLVKICQNY